MYCPHNYNVLWQKSQKLLLCFLFGLKSSIDCSRDLSITTCAWIWGTDPSE